MAHENGSDQGQGVAPQGGKSVSFLNLVEEHGPSEEDVAANNASSDGSSSGPTVTPQDEKVHRVTSFLSYLFMTWTIPVLFKGFRTPLQKSMVPDLERSGDSHILLEQAIREWTVMAEKCPPSKRSIMRLMWKLQRRDIVLGAFIGICQGLLFSVARPLLLRQVILAASNLTSPIANAMGVVVAFCIVVLLEGICQAISKQILGSEASIRFWAWCSGLLEWKAARVETSAVASLGSGIEATSLIGHNISRVIEDWRWGCMMFFSATAVVGGIFVLGFTLGVSALPGIAVLFTVFCLNMRLGRTIRGIERAGHEISAKRINLTQDLAANMLGLKLAAWEEPYKKLLSDVRAEDTKNIQTARATTLTSVNLGRASPVIASSVSILVLAAVSPSSLNAATIFTALTAFQGLRLPLIALPSNIIMIQNARVTFERLLLYLNLPDTKRPEPSPDFAIRAEDCSFVFTLNRKVDDDESKAGRSRLGRRWRRGERKQPLKGMGSSVRFFTTAPGAGKLIEEDEAEAEKNNANTVVPTPQVASLANVNIQVDFSSKRLVAIVGIVASGKSTLLKGLLGQLPLTKGTLNCSRSVGYVPQKPFVLSGSILENILMGEREDKARLMFALKASDFVNDIPQFARGLDTSIGERGQTLSGGQKQRLAICRALYRAPELLVCDDALSAVDVRVANTIFDGIVEYVNEDKRACVMALNQLHFLPRFDWVVVMDHGRIVEQGTFADIKNLENGALNKLLKDQPESSGDTVDDGRAPTAASLQKQSTSTSNSFYLPQPPSNTPDSKNAEEKEIEDEPLVAEETGTRGTGVKKVVSEYVGRMGRLQVPISLVLGVIAYSLMSANDILLAYWTQHSRGFTYQENLNRAYIYFGIAIGHVLMVEFLSLWNMRGSVRSSRRLHADVVETLLHAPVSFYESTPSGRIVSRLSGDLNMTDRNLAFVFDDLFHFTFVILGLTITIAIIVPPLVAFMLASLIFFAVQLVLVDRTNRETKRYANQALSPILTNVAETVNARAIIQLMGYERYFLKRHCDAMDEFNRYSLLSSSVVNLGTMFTGVIAFFVSVGAAFLVVFLRSSLDPSLVGLALVYSQIQPYFLGILSTVLPLGLTALTSLERILEFCSSAIPSERPWHTPKDTQVAPWPNQGGIVFDNVVLIYRPGLPPSLRNVSFDIKGGEVVGIVGRTGAGKSSILVALLRIHEISSGRILIDGADASQMGLQTLRRAVVVIPQEPVLLAGTVFFNIDPFGTFSKEEIESVARRVGLEQSSLDKPSADLLSSGERQLLQMTRAILRKNSSQIVILDEPTSNIDSSTDKALELIVREEFLGKTRLVIAHRLSTVIRSDKIVVMQRGTVIEFGSPEELMAREGGEFRIMMDAYNEANRRTDDVRQ